MEILRQLRTTNPPYSVQQHADMQSAFHNPDRLRQPTKSPNLLCAQFSERSFLLFGERLCPSTFQLVHSVLFFGLRQKRIWHPPAWLPAPAHCLHESETYPSVDYLPLQ